MPRPLNAETPTMKKVKKILETSKKKDDEAKNPSPPEKNEYKQHHIKKSKLHTAKHKKKKVQQHLKDAESQHQTLFEDKIVPEEDMELWHQINEKYDDNLWNRIGRYRGTMAERLKPDNYRLTKKDRDPSLNSTFMGHSELVTALDFSPDGSRLASVGMDSSLFLWKIKGNMFPLKYVHHELGGVHCVRFSPVVHDGNQMIATGGNDRHIRIMKLGLDGSDNAIDAHSRPHESYIIKGHKGAVHDVSFDKTGNYLLSCSSDNSARLWSLEYCQYVNSYLGHSLPPLSCDISYDGRVLVTAGRDRSIKLFDTNSSSCIVDLRQHNDYINKVRFSPDGTSLASCSDDNSIRLFDLRYSGKPLQKFEAHNYPVTGIDFHRSGNYLVSTGEDNSIKLWNLMHAQLMYTISGHSSSTQCARFSCDGQYFATGGADANVLLWNTNFAERHSELCEIAFSDCGGCRTDGGG